MNEYDFNHLVWIYNRLVNQYGVDPEVDWMLKFEKIIQDIEKLVTVV